ncbi:MAG: peptidyl-prolyl cis-trans isomerase [Hydrocarboniphaga sp.]|uniref:peptidylprolyl isomerase n=1 Tax=Hydrocarboniphaga sp. TaxID=2033016 RepID=UPI002605487F|nr:peptidylprolyl isomerase [Hydrocarboniphaga sp.]MDB5973170.1 peptidyl-prolyl cis-trans isomerase [Hydrocarboniphaga sp.]
MTRLLSCLLLLICTSTAAAQSIAAAAVPTVVVRMETSVGRIVLQLDPQHAPKTVANFVGYVNSGYYNGLIFSRVIAGFMAQGGGYDSAFKQRKMQAPVRSEADNGLKNVRGSIAMARTGMPQSATSEFFINFVDNTNLDYPSFDGWGYAVFGRVIEGMDVVDKMEAIPTGPGGPFPSDVPQTPIIITRMTVDPSPAK